MCLTNIVFIKYYLVRKVRIFSKKMYILFSRNDIIYNAITFLACTCSGIYSLGSLIEKATIT
jgi:hypothetical protein